MRDRKRPGYVAYHEAGHVLAAWHYGAPLRYASIIPDGDYAGAAAHGGLAQDDRLARHSSLSVIRFAGPAAQRISHPRSPIRLGATIDHARNDITAEALFECMHSRRGFLRQTAGEARVIVRRYWFAIDRVARALQGSKALSGHALEPIIAEAEEDWRAASAWQPDLCPIAYSRRLAIAAQGLPALRRDHLADAVLRASIAGAADIEAAALAELTARGYREADVLTLLAKVKAA